MPVCCFQPMMSSARRRRYGVVSSSESRASASERFANALADSLSSHHEITRVVSTTAAPPNAHPSVSMASPRPLAATADELNRCDLAIIHDSVDHDEFPNRQDATELSSGERWDQRRGP
jgi:hypothetical protein